MRRLMLAAVLALLPLSVQADEIVEAHHTLETYQALPEAERTAYVAGIADAVSLLAAQGENQRLQIIAGCLQGFTPDALRQAAEAGPANMQIKWAASAPAANWLVQTMILVCQLQLPPE